MKNPKEGEGHVPGGSLLVTITAAFMQFQGRTIIVATHRKTGKRHYRPDNLMT